MQHYCVTVGQVNLARPDYVVAFIFKNSLSEKKLQQNPFDYHFITIFIFKVLILSNKLINYLLSILQETME